VKSLVVFLLGCELEVIGLLLSLDKFMRDLYLISILCMTPIDLLMFLKSLSNRFELIVQKIFQSVNLEICIVKEIVKSWLWLWNVVIAVWPFLPKQL
jgi:hypothetical protein